MQNIGYFCRKVTYTPKSHRFAPSTKLTLNLDLIFTKNTQISVLKNNLIFDSNKHNQAYNRIFLVN